MAARRTHDYRTAICQICHGRRTASKADQASCYCAECSAVVHRISEAGGPYWQPDDLPLEEYAERHVQLSAHANRITAELEAGAA